MYWKLLNLGGNLNSIIAIKISARKHRNYNTQQKTFTND